MKRRNLLRLLIAAPVAALAAPLAGLWPEKAPTITPAAGHATTISTDDAPLFHTTVEPVAIPEEWEDELWQEYRYRLRMRYDEKGRGTQTWVVQDEDTA